jgi:hypothetical protein
MSSKARVSVSLSSRGLKNIVVYESDNDFLFVLGDAEYQCPSFVADFLSPRVETLHSDDRTLNCFRVSVSDPDRDFESFVPLGRGEEHQVERSKLNFFRSVYIEMGNHESFKLLIKEFNDEVTAETAIDQLLWLDRCRARD